MTDFIKTKWWILVIAAVVLIAGSVFLFVHPYGEWTTDKAATCTEDGVSVRKCKICGRKETQPIKAAGHQYSEWSVKQEATCTEDGTLMRTCSVCKNEDTKADPAKGHKFDSWKTVKASTCKVKGVKEHTCKVCGEKEKEDIALAKHIYKDSVAVAATCTKDGTMKHTCKVCGDSYTDTIKCTGHKWQDATCTSPKKCSACGKTEGSALGHDYDVDRCKNCGQSLFICNNSLPQTVYTDGIFSITEVCPRYSSFDANILIYYDILDLSNTTKPRQSWHIMMKDSNGKICGDDSLYFSKSSDYDFVSFPCKGEEPYYITLYQK